MPERVGGGLNSPQQLHSLAKESAELQEMAKLSVHKREWQWQWQGRSWGRWWGRWLFHKCSFPGARGYPNIKRITHAAATAGPLSWQIVLAAGWDSVFPFPNGKMHNTQWCQKSISILISYKICFLKEISIIILILVLKITLGLLTSKHLHGKSLSCFWCPVKTTKGVPTWKPKRIRQGSTKK